MEQPARGRQGGSKDGRQMQLGAWQLWRSLPRSCKFFLLICVVQAFTSGAFASAQLARVGPNRLQDLLLILISAIYFLLLVLDAFWRENGYQLLACMASGGLNLVQLIVYASSLAAQRDDTAVGVVAVCAAMQASAVALARWAYLGFGWRMYSKVACDQRLPDADRRRAAGLRLDRFYALAKLDAQLLALLLVVGTVNGANPGGALLAPLLSLSAACAAGAAAWLAACCVAVVQRRRALAMAAEFTYPLCYIMAAAFMFSSIYYGYRLAQVHGQAYLFAYPVLFVVGRTAVWWDARLQAAEGGRLHLHHAVAAAVQQQEHQHAPIVPPDLLPLVRGAWLLKLPPATAAAGSRGGGGAPRGAAAAGGRRGRWRFFQLSHDGSTLRWDWRKYVLLLHVEEVCCCEGDLTVTLSLTLEPDLRLKFPDQATYLAWAHGLRLLVKLLGNPDGLGGRASTTSGGGSSSGSGDLAGLAALSAFGEPGSPSRLLHRLASASGRASAAGLLSKASMEAAAKRARRALGSTTTTAGSGGGADDTEDSGKVADKGVGAASPPVIKLQAASAALSPRPGSASSVRQRTPTRQQADKQQAGRPPGGAPPSKLRRGVRQPGAAAAAEGGFTWLRRALTAPATAFASALYGASGGAPPSSPTKQPLGPLDSSDVDLEAPPAATEPEPARLAEPLPAPAPNNPLPCQPQPLQPATAQQPRHAYTGQVPPPWPLPRHFRSTSLGSNGECAMPPVPEAHPAFEREATLARWNSDGGSAFVTAVAAPPFPQAPALALVRLGSGGGGSGSVHVVAQAHQAQYAGAGAHSRGRSGEYHIPAAAFVRHPSLSPVPSAGSPPALPPQYPPARGASRGSSPLKPANAPAPLLRHGSLPAHQLQRAGSGVGTHSPGEGGAPPAALPRQLFPPPQPQQLRRLGSGGWAAGGGTPSSAGTVARHDSLGGGQWAPGSTVWQAMFDAGMHAGNYPYHQQQQQQSGSAEGSPSPSATPHSVRSVARSVAVAVELIDYEELKFGRQLGQGAEGPVYAAWYQETPVAVKRTASASEVDMHLAAGFHDNVVNLRGVAQHGQHAYLVMELCPRGTLDVLIHKGASPARLDPLKLLPIVRCIARGMLHLHTRSPPLLHRDLKPANVFIGHGNLMKVGDFGMARHAVDTRGGQPAPASAAFPRPRQPAHCATAAVAGGGALQRTLTPGVIGTAAYSAPELLHPDSPRIGVGMETERLLKADVYSFGVLLWELLERRRPYPDLDGFQVQTQWVLDPESMRLPLPAVPEGLPPQARAVMEALVGLVKACTAWDTDQRPSFRDILAVLRAAAAGDADGGGPETPAAGHLSKPY